MNKASYERKKELVKLLKTQPYLFGKALGFSKLTKLNNEWIIDMVFGEKDETLQAHRGSYKTTCVSIALVLIIILFPNEKTKFFRKTDSAVKEIIRQVSKMLKHDVTKRIVKALWGVDLKILKDSANEITTNLPNDPRGTSQLCASGFKSSMTGQHYDRIFTDDIVTLEDRISRAERDATINSYYELKNIINPTGRIFNSGTPWHKEDAFKIMPSPKTYTCYETGLMSEEEIAEKRRQLTPSLFAANYELKHIADENVLFTERPVGASINNVIGAFCHIDSAYGGEDYTAFTAMAYKDGKFYIYGKCWQKHIESCYQQLFHEYERLDLGKCWTETNADKGFVARDLKRKYGMRMVTYHEGMNKFVKISTYLKAIWENVIFVEGTDEEYISQILDYTEDAEHDDCADSAACLAMRLYKKAGVRIAVGIDDSVNDKEI